MYLGSNNNNPRFKILSEEKCDPSCSVLCLRQHVSVYRPKIINKIQNKSYQSKNYPEHTLILDFRTAQFDAISLSKEISAILRDIGEQYPSLVGIIFALRKKATESRVTEEPFYHFVSNPYSRSINFDIMDKLNDLAISAGLKLAQVIQVMLPIIIYKSGFGFSVSNLCINGPCCNSNLYYPSKLYKAISD
jgi:hypothetical protein